MHICLDKIHKNTRDCFEENFHQNNIIGKMMNINSP